MELFSSQRCVSEVKPERADISLMELLFIPSLVRDVNPESADISLMELTARLSVVSEVNPLKSLVFNDVISAPPMLREVILARCAVVTSFAESTSGTAATIASRTCWVRSLRGGSIPATTTVTEIVCVAVKLPSFAVTVIVALPAATGVTGDLRTRHTHSCDAGGTGTR